MQHTHPGSPGLIRRMAGAVGLVSLLVAVAATLLGGVPAAAATSAAVSVRVEGSKATLVASTNVVLTANKVVKNGVAADSCPGHSAAGALELATHGDWSGTWSASYRSYFLTGIEGLTFPSSGAEYWAFWVNDAPSAAGICSYVPKRGDSLLFFPDCYGKSCPKSAGVLGAKAPAVALVGKTVVVTVTAYSDAKGTPSPAAGATVRGGGVQARTGSGGTATVSFAHAGEQQLEVTAPHAIRTQTSVCVETAAAKKCA
jgi:hypothetical protein